MANIIEQSKKILEHIIKLSANDTLTAQEWLDLVEAFTEVMHGGDSALKGLYTQAEQALITANQMIKSKITSGEELLKVQKAEKILGGVRPGAPLFQNFNIEPATRNSATFTINGGLHPYQSTEKTFLRFEVKDQDGKDMTKHIKVSAKFKGNTQKTVDLDDANKAADDNRGITKANNPDGTQMSLTFDNGRYSENELANLTATVNAYWITEDGVKSHAATAIITPDKWYTQLKWCGFITATNQNSFGMFTAWRVDEYNTHGPNDSYQPQNEPFNSTIGAGWDATVNQVYGYYNVKYLPFYYMRRWVVRNTKPGAHGGNPKLTIDIAANYKDNIKSPTNELTGWDADNPNHAKVTSLDPEKDQIFVSIPDHYYIEVQVAANGSTYNLVVCSIEPFTFDIENDSGMFSGMNPSIVGGNFNNQQGLKVDAIKVPGFMYSAFPVTKNKTQKFIGSYPLAQTPDGTLTFLTAASEIAKWMHKDSNTQDHYTNLRPELWYHRQAINRLYSVDIGYLGDLCNKGTETESYNFGSLAQVKGRPTITHQNLVYNSTAICGKSWTVAPSENNKTEYTGHTFNFGTINPNGFSKNPQLGNDVNATSHFTNFCGIANLWLYNPSMIFGVNLVDGVSEYAIPDYTNNKEAKLVYTNTEVKQEYEELQGTVGAKDLKWGSYPVKLDYESSNIGFVFSGEEVDAQFQSSNYDKSELFCSAQVFFKGTQNEHNGLVYIYNGHPKGTLSAEAGRDKVGPYSWYCDDTDPQVANPIAQVRCVFPLELLPQKEQEMIMGKHNKLVIDPYPGYQKP